MVGVVVKDLKGIGDVMTWTSLINRTSGDDMIWDVLDVARLPIYLYVVGNKRHAGMLDHTHPNIHKNGHIYCTRVPVAFVHFQQGTIHSM